ncbi:hypothetical protein [Ottowia sp.]|uniref:hypothetical protein n=1 Tax=Ottowia sp. TaxID=1898956 RepID=UPI0025CE7C61|nr:hypothetical protein [Ottowia sp.]MBK6616226.1 hypothetical protein [Ottowia sp.]
MAEDLVSMAALIARCGGTEGPLVSGKRGRIDPLVERNRTEVQWNLTDYLMMLSSKIAIVGGLTHHHVRHLRHTTYIIGVPVSLRCKDELEEARRGLHGEVLGDVVALLVATEKMCSMLARFGPESLDERLGGFVWTVLAGYVLALSSGKMLTETPEESLQRCRRWSADTVALLDNFSDERAFGSHSDSAVTDELKVVRGLVKSVCGEHATQAKQNNHREEVVFDEGAAVDAATQALVRAWRCNEAVSRPDDTSTSKVHILSGLVRKRVIAGSTEEKELRRPFAEFLADGVMVLGVEMNALTVLASELFLPVALAFMLERMRKQGLGEDTVPLALGLASKAVGVFVEYDLRTLAGDLTVEQTMLCGRPKERWSGVEQNLVELTPAQRANVFEFDGMHASFEASWDVCTPTGVTPVQGCLTVWAQGSGSFLGRVRGYWFASKHAEDLLQRGPDAYSIFALMLNEEFGNMAQALCAQLGERQPQSPVVFAHCVERHPQRSSPGLGVAMLVEFVKRVREMEPLIDTVAINVEPAQFVLRPWEDPISAIEATRFAAREKVKRWCETSVIDAVMKLHAMKQVVALGTVGVESDEITVPADMSVWR